MTVIEKINKEIANELDQKVSDIEKATKSMWDFLTDNIEQGDRRPIRMQYLGLWECLPTRVRILKEKGKIE